MRILDRIRLAFLSLKARKKTTLQGIFGLSFGLILLFPLLYLVIGFYGGFNAELNAQPLYRTQTVEYSSVKTISGNVLLDEQFEGDVNKVYGIKNTIKYNYCYLLNERNDQVMFSINNGEKFEAIKPSSYGSPYCYIGLEIIDQEYGHKPFVEFDTYFFGKPLVAGKTFDKKNSKGEVMVSTTFLRDYGLDSKKIVGSTLSVYSHVRLTKHQFSSSKDEVIKSNELKKNDLIANFINFKIVGVYNSGIYYKRSPRTAQATFDVSGSRYLSRKPPKDYFWITSASLGEDGVASAPEKIYKEVYEESKLVGYNTWFYYEDTPLNLSERITNSGYAFIPFGLGAFSRGIFNPLYTSTQLIEFYNFQTARKGYEKIRDMYKKSVTGDGNHFRYPEDVVPKRFEKYQDFYDRFIYVCIGLASFGGIMFIATLLNITNTMYFAVDSSKGFIGICRAQGMKKKSVRKLFLSQINLIFISSYLAAIVFGGAACVAIKLLFDNEVQGIILEETKVELTLHWFYIPIALAVLVIITTIISLTISKILVKRVNGKSIIQVLTEGSEM